MPHHTHHSCLEIVPIFSGLSPEQMQQITAVTRERTYSDRELIYRAGEQDGKLLVVHTGHVRVYRLGSEGGEQVLRIISPGEFIGEIALFSPDPVTEYAEAVGECSVCEIGAARMRTMMEQHPVIAMKIMAELSRRLEQADSLIHGITKKRVEQRLAGYLLAHADGSRRVDLPVAKGVLASLLGMSQESLSRKLSLLQEEGLIELTGSRTITILESRALEELSGL